METQTCVIVGGPSKFDFLMSVGLRKQTDDRNVRFKVRWDGTSSVEEIEVEIIAIMQAGEREDGECHWWRFVASYPMVARQGNWVRLPFWILGVYSTGGKRGRTGGLRSLSYEQTQVIDAAFGSEKARTILKIAGYRLPNTVLRHP